MCGIIGANIYVELKHIELSVTEMGHAEVQSVSHFLIPLQVSSPVQWDYNTELIPVSSSPATEGWDKCWFQWTDLMSWLYLASRSDRHGAPVLICNTGNSATNVIVVINK